MKRLTFGYDTLPRFRFEVILNEADIDQFVKENQVTVISIEDVKED